MSGNKTCPECGKTFEPGFGAVTKVFCSTKCQLKHWNKCGAYSRPQITFVCANPKCGRTVVTEGGNDARTRFCCAECERAYWKHAYRRKGHERQNFRSIDEYASWERRTNA